MKGIQVEKANFKKVNTNFSRSTLKQKWFSCCWWCYPQVSWMCCQNRVILMNSRRTNVRMMRCNILAGASIIVAVGTVGAVEQRSRIDQEPFRAPAICFLLVFIMRRSSSDHWPFNISNFGPSSSYRLIDIVYSPSHVYDLYFISHGGLSIKASFIFLVS